MKQLYELFTALILLTCAATALAQTAKPAELDAAR